MASIINGAKLTFTNEGSTDSNSKYYSRKPHWPGSSSGVTLGRGYDMKEKSESKIKSDLTAAGLSPAYIELLIEASFLDGDEAQQFVKKPEIQAVEITEDQEILLFNISYIEKQRYSKQLCQKEDVVQKFGSCDWSQIDSGIKDFITDLTYRGDYTANIRNQIQKAIITNDYTTIIKVAKDKSNWPSNLDSNRFNQRIRHLEMSEVKYKSLQKK